MTIITTLDASAITAELAVQIGQFPTLADKGLIVEVSEPVNERANRTPWLGIYLRSEQYDPRTLGFGAGYRRETLALTLLFQEADVNCGADCHKKLSYGVQQITSAILSDPSIGGLVLTLGELNVAYNYTAAGDDSFMQTAIISMDLVVNVGAQ